jgi:hypothetical protein
MHVAWCPEACACAAILCARPPFLLLLLLLPLPSAGGGGLLPLRYELRRCCCPSVRSAVPPAVLSLLLLLLLLQALRIALLLLLPCACEHQAGTCACHDAQRTVPLRAAGAPPPHSRWFAPPPRHVLHCVSTTLLMLVLLLLMPRRTHPSRGTRPDLLGARTRRAERDPTCARAPCLCANERKCTSCRSARRSHAQGRARPIVRACTSASSTSAGTSCSNRTARSARDSGARIRSTVKSNTNLPLPLTCSAYRCVCAQRTIIPPREPQQQQGSNRKQRREPMQHG